MGLLEAKTQVQSQIPADLPVVLREVIIVPDAAAAHRAAEVLRVPRGGAGSKPVPIGESVKTADLGVEKAVRLIAIHVHADLHVMRRVHEGDGISVLIGVLYAALRDVVRFAEPVDLGVRKLNAWAIDRTLGREHR